MSVLDVSTEIQIGDIYDVHFCYMYVLGSEEYNEYRERTIREANRIREIIENLLIEDYSLETIIRTLREHADYGKDLVIVDASDYIRSKKCPNNMFLQLFVKMSTYEQNYASLIIEEK